MGLIEDEGKKRTLADKTDEAAVGMEGLVERVHSGTNNWLAASTTRRAKALKKKQNT